MSSNSWPEPAKHEVTDEYRQHVRDEWMAEVNKNPMTDPTPFAPFGTHLSHEWNWDNRRKKMMKEVGLHKLPIEGPPNWDQLWPDWDDIGTDHQKTIPQFLGNTRRIVEYLSRNNEQYKNISFVDLLGEGLFGQVWRITLDQKDGRKVEMACKIVRLEQTGDMTLKEAVDTMMADMLVLRYLKHKNIMNFIDFVGIPDKQTGFIFSNVLMFIELLSGDLAQIMEVMGENSRMPAKYCLHWFRQIGSAVKYLHQKNVIHFDLKPNNILFKLKKGIKAPEKIQWKDITDMIFKLGDFGLAACYDSDQTECMVSDQRGNFMYMSPEMTFKKSGTSVKAKPCDIYSLGMCLANAYVGSKLFDGYVAEISEQMELAYMWNQGPFGFGWQYRQFAQLIYSMTIHDPNLRPTIDTIIKY